MKNNFTSFSCLIALLCLLNSCRTIHSIDKESRIDFDTIHVNKLNYFSYYKSNCCANLVIDFIYPRQTINLSTLKILQNLFIKKTFGKSFDGLNSKQATKKYIQLYLQGVKKTFNQTKNTKDGINDKYYLRLKNHILYQGNQLLSFTIETVSYEGGVHPSTSLQGYVFNLSTNQLLNENQFGNTSYSKNISNILTHKIMEKNKCIKKKELENLGYNLASIVPNNNFTVDKNGITYYFNEYEIGSYFLGLNQIFLPYKEINMYILKDSPLSIFITK